MDPRDIVATTASAWQCEPVGRASGTPKTGAHVSILQDDGSGHQEASAGASPEFHTLCFPLLRYTSEVVLDGRWSAAAKVGKQELCVVPARRQP